MELHAHLVHGGGCEDGEQWARHLVVQRKHVPSRLAACACDRTSMGTCVCVFEGGAKEASNSHKA